MIILRARFVPQTSNILSHALPGNSGLTARRAPACSAHDRRPSVTDIGALYDVRVVAGLPGVGEATELLADAFDDLEEWEATPLERRQYQLKLAVLLSWQALLLGQRFLTLSVYPGVTQEQSEPVGVATLTPNAGAQAIPGPLPKALQQLRLAVVSNMAVLPGFRRRGLGAALLGASEMEAVRLGYSTTALLVHQYNDAALRLYEGRGYVAVPEWEDQEWLESVARSRVGPARRVLMVKHLAPAGRIKGLR